MGDLHENRDDLRRFAEKLPEKSATRIAVLRGDGPDEVLRQAGFEVLDGRLDPEQERALWEIRRLCGARD